MPSHGPNGNPHNVQLPTKKPKKKKKKTDFETLLEEIDRREKEQLKGFGKRRK